MYAATASGVAPLTVGVGMTDAEDDKVEARIGDTRAEVNTQRVSPALVDGYMHLLPKGTPVTEQSVERPLLLLNDLPGVKVSSVLRPGAPFVVSFSNRCFPTKAVAIWQALDGQDQCRLVELYLTRAGFASAASRELPSRGDPVWAVIGRA